MPFAPPYDPVNERALPAAGIEHDRVGIGRKAFEQLPDHQINNRLRRRYETLHWFWNLWVVCLSKGKARTPFLRRAGSDYFSAL